MTLIDSVINQTYVIKKITTTNESLLQRFYSMGIYEGNLITAKHFSLLKYTLTFSIYGTQVALRKNEANLIEIEPNTKI